MSLWLQLRDWMSHADTRIEVDDGEVAMVVGANGIGKTAIRDALEYVYLGTGKLRGIDRKSDLGALSIRDGARKCQVQVLVQPGDQDGTRIWRTMKPSGAQRLEVHFPGADGPEEIPLSEADDRILDGVAPDALRMVLDPMEWFRMSAERRAELLIMATRSQADSVETVDRAMLECLVPDTEAERRAIRKIAQRIAEDGFRAGEEQAREARQAAKRALAEIPTQEPDPMFEGIDLSAAPLAAHEKRLAELRAERERAVVTSAESVAAARARADDAYQALQALLEHDPGEPDTTAEGDHATAENGLQQAQDVLERWCTAHAEAQAELDRLRAAQDGTAAEVEHPGQCPHLPVLKCPAKLETFRKAASAAAPQEPTAGELDDAERAVAAAETGIEGAETSVAKWREDLEKAAQRLEAERKRVAAAAALREQIDAAEARVSALDAEAKVSEAAAAEAATEAGAVAEVDAKIQRGERVVAAKRTFDEAVQRHAQYREAAESKQREIDCWHAIATELKPGGPIERKAGGESSQPFLEALADFAPLTGEIDLEPDMSLRVGPERRHPAQLSTSQRMALGMALQHAFATRMDFPILCCDALDTFDGERRGRWLQIAQQIRPRYRGGILGLATTTSARVGNPPPGCVTFHLTGRPGAVEVEALRSETA